MFYDNDYYDLMALAEGYSAEDVDCFGGDVLLEMVNMSAIKATYSKEMKDCKRMGKEAIKLAKKDPEAAKKKFDEAIKAYEDLKKSVRSKIKDDNMATFIFGANISDLWYQTYSGQAYNSKEEQVKNYSKDAVCGMINDAINYLKKEKAKL